MPFCFPSSKLKFIGAAILAGAVAHGAAYAQSGAPHPGKSPQPSPTGAAAPAPQQQGGGADSPPAAAGGPSPQGPTKLELHPNQTEWTKVCGKDQTANKEVCYTTRDFNAGGSAETDKAPVLALAIYDIKGDDTKMVRLLLPPGLMLKPGIRISADKLPTLEGAFEICFPNGCFAEVKMKTPQLDILKKIQTMNVAVKNQAGAELTFVVPMEGFSKSFDGAAIDPKVLEQQQKELESQLQKRADEERKKIEAEKNASSAPVVSAPSPAPSK